MKIVYQGDVHLRDTRPINRIDDYWATELRKLEQLVGFANAHNAYLFLGGDLYDTHKVSPELINRTAGILNKVKHPIVSVLGQHDVPYHQVNPEKSPVETLHVADVIDYLGVDDVFYLLGNIAVHCSSWEHPPKIPSPGRYNILLGHISVFNSIPFYWKGEGYTPKTLREKYPGFDLYLCGDIHIPLVDKDVVVSGPMLRSDIGQVDLKPRCYLIDTQVGSVDPLYYDIEDGVFNIPEAKPESSMDLTDLVTAMRQSGVKRASFKDDCLNLAKDNEPVKLILKGIFDELD